MRLIAILIISAVMMVGMSTTGNAYDGEWRNPDHTGRQDWHGGPDSHESIRERIRESDRRIERGIERGSLTRREARRLRGELGHIMDKIHWLRSDGRLDSMEREVIHKDLDMVERDIRREKRDDDRRNWRGYERDPRPESNLYKPF